MEVKNGTHGQGVKDLQKGINEITKRHGFDWRHIPVDGKAGPATLKAANLALWLIGASNDQLKKVRGAKGRVLPRAYDLLVGSKAHSQAMQTRAKQRAPEAKKLREQHHSSNVTPVDGTAPWRSFRVAAWMVGAAEGPDGTKTNWLQLSVNKGWSGDLYSGFRDPAYSRSLCEQMCGAPSCPGMCAGESSNHSQTGPPNWGAIDVHDPDVFGPIQKEIGSPLKNDLPNDHNHYSYTGR